MVRRGRSGRSRLDLTRRLSPWQIAPTILGELIADPDPARASRVFQAMMGMKKLDIKGLKEAAGRQ